MKKCVTILGKKVFKINCDQGQILLTTSTGAPIPEKRIENLIEAAGPYLSVHLYLDRKDGKSGIVIPNVCHNYVPVFSFIHFPVLIFFYFRILNRT